MRSLKLCLIADKHRRRSLRNFFSKMADLRMSLRGLQLQDVEETGREIARGAYGVVKEVKIKGCSCAGKELHEEFVTGTNSDEKQWIADRFEQEILQLGNLRHPNIVLLMGVYFKPGSELPILVMECLPLSLTDCLKRYPNIPDYITSRILLDVAKGLHFLHDRREPIIHRDLTANNVLLSDTMQAKIADLGVARILSDKLRTMTKVPGNATYMPPEAFSGAPKYDKSLDIFSFGVLILHTVNHEWPHPNQDLFERSPTNPRKCIQVAETERRATHLEKMGKNHQLMELTVRCLSDDPNARPGTFNLVQEFEKFSSLSPRPYTNSIEMLQVINSKSEENRRLEVQNQDLKVKERELETTNHDMSTQIEAQVSRVSALEQDLRNTRVLLNMKEREVATKMEEISTKDSVLEARRREVEALGLELRALRHNHPEENHFLAPTATLEWTQAPDLPNGRRHPQAVVHNNKAYVGGGYSGTDELDHQVYVYDLGTDTWDTLPSSPTRWFAMTIFDDKLVLVGGKEKDEATCTNKVVSFDEEEQAWVQDHITPMPTARMGSSAVVHASYLIVAGGWDDTRFRLSTVEICDREKNCWYMGAPLPQTAAEMKQALGNNSTWFLLGGANQGKSVFYTSLQTLVEKAMQPSVNSATAQDPTDPVWRSLPDSPYHFSSAAIFGSCLLALGGKRSHIEVFTSAVYVYIPHTHSWLQIADMPLRQCRACAVTLPSGELLVIGGKAKDSSSLRVVHKCTPKL